MATNYPETSVEITEEIQVRITKLAAEASDTAFGRMYDFEEAMELEKLLGSKRLYRALNEAHQEEAIRNAEDRADSYFEGYAEE